MLFNRQFHNDECDMGRGKVDEKLKMKKRYQVMVTEAESARIERAKDRGGYLTVSDLFRDGVWQLVEKIESSAKK